MKCRWTAFSQDAKLADANFAENAALLQEDRITRRQGRRADNSPARAAFVFSKKAVDMAVVAAIGVTVGFAILRGVVRRAAIRSGRKKRITNNTGGPSHAGYPEKSG